jgi:uncharacterized membrane protein YedE/YeeE
MKRWPPVVAFVSGLVFAFGLGVSGMGRPAKVLAFLDVSGDWDPSLAFVMVSAIAVHAIFVWRAKRADRPVLGGRFVVPPPNGIDASLWLGAGLFGIGWGLVGYCPGPAVMASASAQTTPLVFVAAMMAGLLLHRALVLPRRLSAQAERDEASAPP